MLVPLSGCGGGGGGGDFDESIPKLPRAAVIVPTGAFPPLKHYHNNITIMKKKLFI